MPIQPPAPLFPDDPTDQVSQLRWVWRGFVHAAGIPALVLMASLVGVGGLTRDIGYPLWAGVLSTLLIWAGPAQMLLFGSIAAGASLPAVALAIFLSSMRFLPMTVSLMPLLRGPKIRTWHLMIAGPLVAVTNWSEGIRRLPRLPEEGRYPYFLGFGFTTLLAAAIATGFGYDLIGQLPPVLAAALLFMTPMFFSASLAAGARRPVDWLALAFGFAIAPLANLLLGKDFDLLIGGIAGGTLAYLAQRLLRRRR